MYKPRCSMRLQKVNTSKVQEAGKDFAIPLKVSVEYALSLSKYYRSKKYFKTPIKFKA